MVSYLAMYGNKVSISEALFISVFAMIVVFVILLIISYLIDVSAFFINGKKKTNIATSESVIKNDENKDAKISDAKDDNTLVAIIAAAIASSLNTDVKNIRISRIRRLDGKVGPWNIK